MATATMPQVTPDYAVTVRDFTAATFQKEAQTTRRVIAAIPEEKKTYKADPKAKSAEELAWHVAFNDINFLECIARGSFLSGAEEAKTEQNLRPKTIAGILKWHEEQVPKALAKLQAMTPQQLLQPVDFFGAFNFPAFMYLEFWKVHMVHHRGWLASYLRPMGSKVPSIYGPSGDEDFQG